MTKDSLYGAIFAIIGIVIIIMTSNIPVPQNLTEPGPRVFPFISGIGILVCGAGMVLTKAPEKEEKPGVKGSTKRLLIIGAALVAYYGALYFFGFLLSTPFACFAFIKILQGNEKVSNVFAVILSLVVTSGLYFLFVEVFKIFLPEGKIFG